MPMNKRFLFSSFAFALVLLGVSVALLLRILMV